MAAAASQQPEGIATIVFLTYRWKMDTERSDHLASNQAGLEKEKGNQIYLETNESKNTVIKKLWDTAKAALKGKFIAMQIYLRKQEKLQINNVTLHLKELQKEEQNPKGVEGKKS